MAIFSEPLFRGKLGRVGLKRNLKAAFARYTIRALEHPICGISMAIKSGDRFLLQAPHPLSAASRRVWAHWQSC